MPITKAEYEAIRTIYNKALKASTNADARLHEASDAWIEARAARNKELPDGFYVEADALLDTPTDEYPIYLKLKGEWRWSGGYGLDSIEWLGDDEPFDIDVIPISEVKF